MTALRDLLEKATKAPWQVAEYYDGWAIKAVDLGMGDEVCVSGCDREGSQFNPKPETLADAALIAHLRNKAEAYVKLEEAARALNVGITECLDGNDIDELNDAVTEALKGLE